jgi:putative oxidoreductase
VRASDRLALFFLRVGLGLFLLLWSCDKFVEPSATVHIMKAFYNVSTGRTVVFILGTTEALVGVLIMAGLWKRFSYGVGLTVHAISTVASWKQLMDPFERQHHLFLAAVPVLTGFIALYLLREHDTLWTLDNLPSQPRGVAPR